MITAKKIIICRPHPHSFSNAAVCFEKIQADKSAKLKKKKVITPKVLSRLGVEKTNAMQENQTKQVEILKSCIRKKKKKKNLEKIVFQSRSQALRFSSFLARRFSLKAFSSFLVGFLFERSAFKLRPP